MVPSWEVQGRSKYPKIIISTKLWELLQPNRTRRMKGNKNRGNKIDLNLSQDNNYRKTQRQMQ